MIRSIHRLSSNSQHTYQRCINLTQKRTSFYNKYKHGPTKISNPEPDYVGWVKSFFSREFIDWAKEDLGRAIRKPFRTTLPKHYKANTTYKFEDFDSDESVKGWKPVADSDSLNGFSVSSITRSPAGHGLFKGILDNRIPDDGLTMKSGFAGVIGPRKQRDGLLSIEEFWDWSDFNCVEIRFRGDGRKYGLLVNTGTYMDDQAYYDCHYCPIHTTGGPYWQTKKIPFGKFIFAFKGFVQDEQGKFPDFHVKFVAFTLQDSFDGPFQLEIDYIGLRRETLPFDEVTAFELYAHPHIKFKQLQVDCQAPEQD